MSFAAIFTRKPVNRQASIVTDQREVSDTYLLQAREEVRVLGLRKKEMMDRIIELKHALGIDHRKKNNGQHTKYPSWIVRNPLFREYTDLRTQITELDVLINDANKRIEALPHTEFFADRFVKAVRDQYPDIYQKLREELTYTRRPRVK